MKYQWVALSVTTVGIFMSGLDTRIVLIGLPIIAIDQTLRVLPGIDVDLEAYCELNSPK